MVMIIVVVDCSVKESATLSVVGRQWVMFFCESAEIGQEQTPIRIYSTTPTVGYTKKTSLLPLD